MIRISIVVAALAFAACASDTAAQPPPDPFAGAPSPPRRPGRTVTFEPPATGAADRFGDALPPHALARFGTARLHHSGLGFTVARVGPYVVTAGSGIGLVGASVKIWDSTTGRLVATAQVTDGTSIAADAAGARFVVTSAAGIYLFELRGGAITSSGLARDPDHFPRAAAITRDGRVVATVEHDCRVSLHEVAAPMRVRRYAVPACDTDFERIAISDDAMRIAIADREGKVVVLDAVTGRAMLTHAVAKSHDAVAIAWLAGGHELLEGRPDHVLARWRVDDNRAVYERKDVIDGVVERIAIADDGRDLALAMSQGYHAIAVVAARDGTPVWALDDTEPSWDVALDATQVVRATRDGGLEVYERSTGRPVALQGDRRIPPRQVAFRDEEHVVALHDQQLVEWSLAAPLTAAVKLPTGATGAFALAGARDTAIVQVKHDASIVRLADGKAQRTVSDLEGGMVASSADGRLVGLSDFDTFELVDTRTMKKLKPLPGATPKATPACIAINADGSRVAAVLEEKIAKYRVFRWDNLAAAPVIDGTLFAGSRADDTSVWSCIFASTGELVIGSTRGIDIVDRRGVATHLAKDRGMWRVAGDPRHARFAFADSDGRIGLVDLRTRAIVELGGHADDLVNALAFSPSGDRLASASKDGSILVWDTKAK